MTDAGERGYYPHQVAIDAYGNGGFRFADMSHRGSLLCLPTGMQAWEVGSPRELTLASLAPVLAAADDIDVLLIGLGGEIAAIDPAIRQVLRERGVIVEAVATGGAVRTYNVLLAEKRAVGAAFIAVENARA
ncbi:Mth938-like domain-containing protein [Devosia nitrariae]|uniref:Membrane protein n=1 Tax=Devosia nitrariae TaxID=2071872 RepID=A0ABQ5WC14_9HYPH|nr:MTH938/NDUFAF3 family protein [Devosia nitrariae]GLQ57606.1 membrane protein [Devosia nitrariae]